MSESRPTGGRRFARMLGEIGLIFLGITAALWFEDMNDARHERALELQILGEMSAALTRDIVDLDTNVATSDSVLQSIDAVLSGLDDSQILIGELAMHFARASRVVRFFHSPAAYEHLRSAGFDVISDDALREKIISYYDSAVPALMWIEDEVVMENWRAATLPEMQEKFEYANPWTPALPLNYASLRTDVMYQNVLRTTQFGIANQHQVTEQTLTQADSLLGDIGRQLARR